MSLDVVSSSPLRGSEPVSACMEQFQKGYLRSVVAAAGCTILNPETDYHAVDWQIDHASDEHTEDPIASIKVQLKSTSQDLVSARGDFISLPLPNDQLRKLNAINYTIPRLLIVMLMPRDVHEWLAATRQEITLRHCSYWVNLSGQAINGIDKTVVRVPSGQVFDDVTLCDIMQRVGSGGVP